MTARATNQRPPSTATSIRTTRYVCIYVCVCVYAYGEVLSSFLFPLSSFFAPLASFLVPLSSLCRCRPSFIATLSAPGGLGRKRNESVWKESEGGERVGGAVVGGGSALMRPMPLAIDILDHTSWCARVLTRVLIRVLTRVLICALISVLTRVLICPDTCPYMCPYTCPYMCPYTCPYISVLVRVLICALTALLT